MRQRERDREIGTERKRLIKKTEIDRKIQREIERDRGKEIDRNTEKEIERRR